MDTVQIKWIEGVIQFNAISEFKHQYLDKKGFYALLGARFNKETDRWEEIKLLYIGQAFDQTLRERIPQEHPAYKCVFEYTKKNPGKQIAVMLGIIEKSSVQKLTQELFNDVECCLISWNQPTCNTQCKESYTGRELQVTNTGGFTPLKEKSTCSK